MTSFHEVRFPLRLALGVSGGPERRTDIVNLTNGREARNARWKYARRSYDAGSGIRSVGDLYEVIAFFEARMGELYGFRFRDPVDNQSVAPGVAIKATDQAIGTGDGAASTFQLIKTYGDAGATVTRTIAKPVSGSVRVAVDGVETSDFSVDTATGIVTLATPPADGVIIQAGFEFDVPVRFAIARIDIDLAAFNAGRIPSIPLMEILL
jgi:uncharacterized protein (TIGR02217 family)